jgi:hypothetical protein
VIAAWTFIVWLCTRKPTPTPFVRSSPYTPSLAQLAAWQRERVANNPNLRRFA